MPSPKPNIIKNLRAKHEPHQKLAARVLGLEKRVSKLDGTKALPPGKDTKALPPAAKKTKISADSLKKGTALDPGYASRVRGEDATGEYLSSEERKARFKKRKITGADIKRGSSVEGAENVASEVDANQKAAIEKAKIDIATKYEGSPADDVTPPEADATGATEKGGALSKPTESLIGPLKTIDSGVNGIIETLKSSNKADTKAQTDARKQAEKDARDKKEGKLEGIKDKLSTAAQTVLKPVQNIFQRIWDFLKVVLLGRVVMKLFEWFANPENSKKVASLFRFLKDWWPVLVAGIMAIVGPGIIFTAGLIALLAWGIPKIINIVKTLFGFGPKVDKELKNVEDDADALGKDSKKEVEAQGLEPKEDKAEVGDNESPATDVTPTEVSASEQQAKDVQSGAEQTGDLPEGGQGFAQGGEVPGTGNKDTVPAMLTPGEFVMSKGAVQQYGVGTLAGMNAAAGGTNRPTMGGYKSGGSVQNVKGGDSVQNVKGGTNRSSVTNYYNGGGIVNMNKPGKGSTTNRTSNTFGKGSTTNHTSNTFGKGSTTNHTSSGPRIHYNGGGIVNMNRFGKGSTTNRSSVTNYYNGGGLVNMNRFGGDRSRTSVQYFKGGGEVSGLPTTLGGGGGGTNSLTEQAKVYTKKDQGWFGRVRGGLDMLTGNRWDFDRQDVVANTKADANRTGLENYARMGKGEPRSLDAGLNPPSKSHDHEVILEDPVAKANTQLGARGAPSQELPEFSASKMRSTSKVKTLGIAV